MLSKVKLPIWFPTLSLKHLRILNYQNGNSSKSFKNDSFSLTQCVQAFFLPWLVLKPFFLCLASTLVMSLRVGSWHKPNKTKIKSNYANPQTQRNNYYEKNHDQMMLVSNVTTCKRTRPRGIYGLNTNVKWVVICNYHSTNIFLPICLLSSIYYVTSLVICIFKISIPFMVCVYFLMAFPMDGKSLHRHIFLLVPF